MHEEHLPTDHGWVEALTSYEQGWVFGWRRAYYGAASGLAPRTTQTTPSPKCELAESFQASPGAAKREGKKGGKGQSTREAETNGLQCADAKVLLFGREAGGETKQRPTPSEKRWNCI